MKLFKRSQKDPLPVISTPYNQAVKRQQEALVISLIIAIAIASFYTYFYVQNQIKAEDKVSVLVANKNLVAPYTLTANDFETIMLPRKVLPVGTFDSTQKADLIEKTLFVPLKANQLYLAHYLQSDLDPKSISAQFEADFALSMDEDWFVAKLPNLKANDRIDLVVTNPGGNLDQTTLLARSLKIISVTKSGSKRNLVVNSTEEQAKAILFARGLKLPMQVLVYSAITPPLPPDNN